MSPTHHGPIKIVHSVVDQQELGKAIQQRWGLAEPFQCELLTRGMNDVYLLRSGTEKFAARVWRAGIQTQARVTWEIQFLNHLKARGLPVVVALPDRNGDYTFSLDAPEGVRQVCLFEWAEGRDFAVVPNVDRAERLGRLVGQVNVAGHDFKPATRRPIDFATTEIRNNVWAAQMRLFGRPEAELKFYADISEKIAAGLDAVYARGVPYGPIHGDVHALNAFVDDADRIRLFDFDTCGEAHYAHDLVSFIWANKIFYDNRGMKGLTAEINAAYRAGYEAVRPLQPIERDNLPLFMAAKEISNMNSMASVGRYVGHLSYNARVFDWYAKSVRQHAEEAGLI